MDALLVADLTKNALLGEVLQRRGHKVAAMDNLEGALEQRQRFPLVFIDASHPPDRLQQLIRAQRQASRDAVIVALTDAGHPEQREAAVSAGAMDWMERPMSRALLEARIGLLEQLVAQLSEQARLRDRLERIEHERTELIKSEQSFHALLEAAPDPISIHRDGVILYGNPAAISVFGYPSLEKFVGRRVMELIHPDDRAAVDARIRSVERTGQPAPMREERFLCWDGSVRVGEVYSFRVQHQGDYAVMSVGRDLTEPRRLESMLLHTERLATVGVMTAGIAHELKNPLMFVVCNLVDLCRRLPGLSTSVPQEVLGGLEKRVETALHGAERLQKMTRDLLQFTRASDDQIVAVDLLRVLDSARTMAGPELRDVNVEVEWTDVPLVWGNELRLSQVFLNLLINAAHAVREARREQGVIRVRGSIDSEGYASVDIEDNGVGIAQQRLAQIFEPFYTTKQSGAGTGLGLAVARTIVDTLGGQITVESELNRFTRFRLRLRPASPPKLGNS